MNGGLFFRFMRGLLQSLTTLSISFHDFSRLRRSTAKRGAADERMLAIIRLPLTIQVSPCAILKSWEFPLVLFVRERRWAGRPRADVREFVTWVNLYTVCAIVRVWKGKDF